MDYGVIINEIFNLTKKQGLEFKEEERALLAGSMAFYLDQTYKKGYIQSCQDAMDSITQNAQKNVE